MTTVYFIRHCQPNYLNIDDRQRELTEKGLLDRDRVTDFLKDKQVQFAYSSPYRRSYDTIKPFADEAGIPIQVVEDFRERAIGHVWQKPEADYISKQWADFDYHLSGGESINQVQQRNIQALEQIIRQHPTQTIIVGSHGTAMSAIANYYNPSFGVEDTLRIKDQMPWVVELNFDESGYCIAVREWNI